MKIAYKALLAASLLLLCVIAASAATLLPNGKQQFFNANGTPLAGGFVYFYIPGTGTPKNTYQDSGSTILNTNPLTLDAAGEAIIYGSGAYRQIVTDSAGNLIWDQLTSDTSGSGLVWGGTSTGSANAQAVSAPAFAQSNGAVLYFVAGFSNTGSLTLNVNGTGGLIIYEDTATGPQALARGAVGTGNAVGVVYDATLGAYHLLNPAQPNQAAGSIAAAATTDLGSTGTNLIQINGARTRDRKSVV